MILNIILIIIIIIMLICFFLLLNKKNNKMEIKTIIQKLLINEKINYDEYETGDLIFFINKENDIIWLPSYFTHVGIITKINNKVYILDADPTLNGIFLIEINEYINKYCGNVFFVKINLSSPSIFDLAMLYELSVDISSIK